MSKKNFEIFWEKDHSDGLETHSSLNATPGVWLGMVGAVRELEATYICPQGLDMSSFRFNSDSDSTNMYRTLTICVVPCYEFLGMSSFLFLRAPLKYVLIILISDRNNI